MAHGRIRSRCFACVVVAVVFVAACVSSRDGGGALDPRFVAVHNTLSAMGLVQIGPIRQGWLAEGRDTRVSLGLGAGCTTVLVLGGDGVRDLDAALLDPQGRSLAHDTTNEPEAVLHACVDAPADYVLVVSARSGGGSWTAATWQGGGAGAEGASGGAAGASGAHEADGTCDAPIPLATGTVSDTTTRGEHENAGSCGPSDSRELVYQLDVARREKVTIEVEARFDSVLYLRKDDCADPNAEVDCSDDAPDRSHSRVERTLDPGRYYVFVDGYGHEAGSFKMTVAVSEALALSDACQAAPLLPVGATVTATTAGRSDDVDATCPAGAAGADAPWKLELPSRARVRIAEHSDEMTPVLSVRHACADAQSEIACSDGPGGGDAVVTGVFDPGGYTVFADARDADASGAYSLRVDVAPPSGTGVAGDACSDALPLAAPGGTSPVQGDTFAARDDVTGSCSGAGAPDVVYRLDVPRRSRFAASLGGEEAPHVLVLYRRCGDPRGEVACGRRVEAELAPGAYYVAVDGPSEGAVGRFSLSWTVQDLALQAGACARAPALAPGAVVTGTTAGAGDRFVASCAASDDPASGPDRVYEIALASRARVRLSLLAPSFGAALVVRKSCVDAVGGARAAEVACASEPVDAGQPVVVERTLDAGHYWVVVDGLGRGDEGPFTLDYRVLP